MWHWNVHGLTAWECFKAQSINSYNVIYCQYMMHIEYVCIYKMKPALLYALNWHSVVVASHLARHVCSVEHHQKAKPMWLVQNFCDKIRNLNRLRGDNSWTKMKTKTKHTENTDRTNFNEQISIIYLQTCMIQCNDQRMKKNWQIWQTTFSLRNE